MEHASRPEQLVVHVDEMASGRRLGHRAFDVPQRACGRHAEEGTDLFMSILSFRMFASLTDCCFQK